MSAMKLAYIRLVHKGRCHCQKVCCAGMNYSCTHLLLLVVYGTYLSPKVEEICVLKVTYDNSRDVVS